jgi:P-type E1-E2 ATPase
VTETKKQQVRLQVSFDKFGEVISKGILMICIISFFTMATSLAAIPGSLPAVVTTTLSLGINRMAKQKAIVTKTAAVERVRCTSVICSDKTGTVRVFSVVNRRDAAILEVKSISDRPDGRD